MSRLSQQLQVAAGKGVSVEMMDSHDHLNEMIAISTEQLHELDILEQQCASLESMAKTFEILQRGVSAENPSADMLTASQEAVTAFYKQNGLGDAPSMESTEALTASMEGIGRSISNVLTNLRNGAERFKVGLFNDRDSDKTVKSLEKISSSLRKRLSTSKFEETTIELDRYKLTFMSGGHYITDFPKALKLDAAVVNEAIVNYSKYSYSYIHEVNLILNDITRERADHGKFTNRLFSIQAPQVVFNKAYRGPGKLLENATVDLLWQHEQDARSWEAASKPGEGYLMLLTWMPPVMPIELKAEQKHTEVTITRNDVNALLDYIDSFSASVAAAKKSWLVVGDVILSVVGLMNRVDKIAHQDRENAHHYNILKMALVQGIFSLEKTQIAFFRHGLHIAKTASRVLQVVID